jgi:type I restriction enzyme S subunit
MDMPKGWAVVSWSDIVVITHGQNQKGIEDPDGAYPIYGSGGQIGKASQYLCKAGSTVVGRKGTINRPFFTQTDFWNIDTAFGITPHDEIHPKFLYLFCKHFNFYTLDHSTGRPSLTQTNLYGIKMPLPPLAEQHRIVSKIDALFSKLDKGVEMLQVIRQQLRTYRQAVLKWAFEGKLTRTTWETEILGKIAHSIKIGPFGTLLHKSDYVQGGIPVVNPKHMREYKVNEDNSVSITAEKATELSSYAIYENDVLIARRGEMGRTAYISARENGWLCGTGSMVIRFPKGYLGQLYAYLLSAEQTKKYLIDNCNGTTMSNLNEKIIKGLPMPIISIGQQKETLAAIESRLSVCDKLEAIVEENLSKANALRQSILKKAFAGRLVPQDPSDEPAEKLLERIRTASKQSKKR